jgi:polynucleotide 5'-kinase involved in rRNA processing
MDSAAHHLAGPLSLQDKLDRISHDRKVLDLLRDLMRLGLHDGDGLVHRADGAAGRLQVLRGAEPRVIVVLDDGRELPWREADWERPGS